MIIFLLSGMLFTVSKLAGARATRAKSLVIIQKMSNALSEFYSEYGVYPPVSSVVYEREQSDLTHQSQALIDFLDDHNDPGTPENPSTDTFFPDTAGRTAAGSWPRSTVYGSKNLGYRYGLVSFLWPRAQGSQPHWYDRDSSRDVQVKDGWSSYLVGVPLGGGGTAHRIYGLETELPYTNIVHIVQDGWGHALKYRSLPPHSSYELWSVGPDGKDGTGDDVNNDGFSQ